MQRTHYIFVITTNILCSLSSLWFGVPYSYVLMSGNGGQLEVTLPPKSWGTFRVKPGTTISLRTHAYTQQTQQLCSTLQLH